MTAATAASRQLTRKTQVLAVLAAGGAIYWRGRPTLYQLTDKHGAVVAAWQTAIKLALKEWCQQKSPAKAVIAKKHHAQKEVKS